jgi:hypothetical protein
VRDPVGRPTIPNGRIPSPLYGLRQTIACVPDDVLETRTPELLAGCIRKPHRTSCGPESGCDGASCRTLDPYRADGCGVNSGRALAC